MKIDKRTIVDLLERKGDQAKADQAEAELPEQVDAEQHSSLLAKLGIDPSALIDKIPGGLGGKGDGPSSGSGGLGGLGMG